MKTIPGLGNYKGVRRERILKRRAITLGEELIVPINQDRAYLRFDVIHEWVVTPTFAAGTAAVHPRGVAHALCKRIEVSRTANEVIKLFRGVAQLQDGTAWMAGEGCPSLYSSNASSIGASPSLGTPAPTMGATTVPVAVREAQSIHFANYLSGNPDESVFNTLGVNTAQLKILYGAASEVQDPSNSSTVTWAVTGYVTVIAITADHLGDRTDLDDFCQSYEEIPFATVAAGSNYELKPQGHLQGMFLRAFKGSGRKPLTTEELRNFEIRAEYNGALLFEGNLADLQCENGLKSSIDEFFKTAAYVSFQHNYEYLSGLEMNQADGYHPMKLTISTPSSINHSTDPVTLVAEYDIIKRR